MQPKQTKKRNPWSHKGQFGKVFIIAGSQSYSGSPIFNAVAALRAGADIVTVVGPKRAMDITAAFLPDIITYPLGEELCMEDISKILSWLKNFNAVVIGGGMERNKKTYEIIRALIKKIDLPMVIDAEAIRAIGEDVSVLKGKNTIITPHADEFRALTRGNVKDEVSDRENKVQKWAKKLHATILLKGHVDVISNGVKVALNITGSVCMTKGGFGDTLAGICGALLARNANTFIAAKHAAYINGKAGELACKKYGEGVFASDIFECIPRILNKI